MAVRKSISSRVSAVSPSVTLGIGAMARQMAASGRKVYSFAAGEPDFDTPEHIKLAACDALHSGQTKYSPVPGSAELRGAIAEKLRQENGLVYDPEQIVVSDGAKHSLFNIMFALLEPGDEVIIPSPYWLSYPEMVKLAGGRPVILQCSEEDGFKMAPEQLKEAITARTRAVVINSPSNPTGLVYSPEELRALARTAVDKSVYVISDEIYEKIIYEGAVHASIGNFSEEIYERTITVNGFSKSFSMTGWRLGYIAAAAEIARAVTAMQSHSTSGANTFAQAGAVAALRSSQECVGEMVKSFDERRCLMHRRLESIEKLSCVLPAGAFYMFVNISRTGMRSVEFSEKLLEQAAVAAVPGVAFGRDDHVRLSYACGKEVISAGMDAIETFLRGL
ncbi:MAG: pyridoxal phosphate-dependent aminotransferase [Kiritimatiellia bacterium]